MHRSRPATHQGRAIRLRSRTAWPLRIAVLLCGIVIGSACFLVQIFDPSPGPEPLRIDARGAAGTEAPALADILRSMQAAKATGGPRPDPTYSSIPTPAPPP